MVDFAKWQDIIISSTRTRSFPLTVKFLKEGEEFPEGTRRPSVNLAKRVTICQAVTMARIYGWVVGLDRSDIICVPAILTWGMSGVQNVEDEIISLLLSVGFAKDRETAISQLNSMIRPAEGEVKGILIAPLAKTTWEFDNLVIYGNPAQIMRLVQALKYSRTEEIGGDFQGKIACIETLYSAKAVGKPRISIPGMGDRVFSMTQDDELALAIPSSYLSTLIDGLSEAGKAIGARYPVTFYQNFEPVFPKPYQEIAKKLKLFE